MLKTKTDDAVCQHTPVKRFTVKEIARLSGLSRPTIYRDIKNKKLASLSYCVLPWYEGRYGRYWLCSEEQVLDWLIERNQRCGGLTIESKKTEGVFCLLKTWLAE